METTIVVNGGTVAASDAQAAYLELRDQLATKLIPEVNHLMLADLALLPT